MIGRTEKGRKKTGLKGEGGSNVDAVGVLAIVFPGRRKAVGKTGQQLFASDINF